jgi:predicted permease
MAVRIALGAGRGRLLRQLLIEGLALFLVGGAAGTALALGATRALASVHLPMEVPLTLDFHPDLLVLSLTLLVTLTVGVLFGLAPARQILRTDPAQVLREGGSSIRMARSRLRGMLVTGQVAGTACLLVTAGLFARGLSHAGEIRPGFNPEGISTIDLDLGVRHYDEAKAEAFITGLERRVAAMPGVTAVATTNLLPLNLSQQSTLIALPERPAELGVGRFETDFTSVSPGFFATLGLPLIEGRAFAATDRIGAPAVAIVNQTLARQLWPGEDPIGKRLNFGSFTNGVPTEVVGLAADAKYRSLGEEPVPMIYVPIPTEFGRRITLMVRTANGAAPARRAISDAVHELDPDLPVGQQASLTAIIGIALLPNRVAALLAMAFGITGLLLAALGLYGLLAFRVQSRRKEIGIRMALGASARQIRQLVVGEGVRLTAIGLGIGLAVAAVIGRLLGSMLFGVSPFDPVTYGAIALLLLGVGWFAALGPTRRAIGTDPVEVLRHE